MGLSVLFFEFDLIYNINVYWPPQKSGFHLRHPVVKVCQFAMDDCVRRHFWIFQINFMKGLMLMCVIYSYQHVWNFYHFNKLGKKYEMKNVNPMHACYIVVHCTLELLNLHRSILTKPVKISRSMIPVIKVHLTTTILNFISFKHPFLLYGFKRRPNPWN